MLFADAPAGGAAKKIAVATATTTAVRMGLILKGNAKPG